MDYEIIEIREGHPRYEEILRPVTSDADLLAQIWADAESAMEEHPQKTWWFAVATDGEALAWCAVQPVAEDGRVVMKCTDSYERRGRGRDNALYREVFAARNVALGHMACVTYVFDQPVRLHLEHGWELTGVDGVSDDGHHWQEMRKN